MRQAESLPPPLSAQRERRGPALSWLAIVGEPDSDGRIARLPVRRTIMRVPGSGVGLELAGESSSPLPGSASWRAIGVVFEGVLHDRPELLAALDLAADEVITNAELVARAYERWGESLLVRLRGTYAIVLWDGAQQRLLAARDRLGIYPLFFTRTGRETLFATSADLLLLHPRTSRRLNRVYIAERIAWWAHDARETHYEAIFRVPCGHRLLEQRGTSSLERYWHPGSGAVPVGDRRELYEQFDHLVDRAVARCLDEGPPAIFLSGGLDSVSVAAIAAEQARARGLEAPFALSLVFPDKNANEEPIQRAVASRLGLEQILRGLDEIVPGGRLLQSGFAISRTFPLPVLSLWRGAYLALGEEAKRQGRSSILTGHGGDEWLGVSVFLAADLVRAGDLGGLYRMWWNHYQSYPLGIGKSIYFIAWKYGLRTVLAAAAVRALGPLGPRAVLARKRRHIASFPPAWIAPDPELRREFERRAERYLPEPSDLSPYEVALQDSLDHPMVTLEYEEVYEGSRRMGVPIVAPLLDSELVDFLYRFPPKLLFSSGRSKGPIRETLARRFPELGFDRQRKVGATSFFRERVLAEGREAWNAVGGPVALADLGVVDFEMARRSIMRSIDDRRLHASARLWYVLSNESWCRAHAG